MIPINIRRILKVDLSNRKFKIEEIDEKLYEEYLGGSGIAARILYDKLDIQAQPTDPENPLVFINGLLTGSIVPTACKMSVCARSPLTGIWCESTVGGYFPMELNRAGFGGIFVYGKSRSPVCLWIKDDEFSLFECSDLWNVDTFESSKRLREKTDPKAQIGTIGLAGAKQVKLANIMFGGEDARAAGRGGLGAVMGSKNLKAIAVRGTKYGWVLFDRKGLLESIKKVTPGIKEFSKGLSLFGTAGSVEGVESHGDLPIKNWRLDTWKDGAKITSGKEIVNKMLVKR
ncbi:aldehyde ferredoxin oxidoreductase, partial [Candidatus Poribacteria bacterium]|nr:aldehyde ferredoxin oxidoreductase [Candidatus Poribacteria bacterium]